MSQECCAFSKTRFWSEFKLKEKPFVDSFCKKYGCETARTNFFSIENLPRIYLQGLKYSVLFRSDFPLLLPTLISKIYVFQFCKKETFFVQNWNEFHSSIVEWIFDFQFLSKLFSEINYRQRNLLLSIIKKIYVLIELHCYKILLMDW